MDKIKERLFYIDNLRLFIIVFVVMHHLAVTYSGFGSWYYHEGGHLGKLSIVWFAFYLSLQQGYFMGLLFMISGYFVAQSFERKSFGKFIGDRFKRLIIPSLIYMVVITPFIGIVEIGYNKHDYKISDFLSGTGVMWFAVALFVFSLIYGIVRLNVQKDKPLPGKMQFKSSIFNEIILILIIAVCAFLIRLVQPIGTNVLNMQLCYFASYIVLFIIGIISYKNNLFGMISYKTGKRWLLSGIFIGFFVWLVLVIIADKTGKSTALNGGFNWLSAGYSLWESFISVAMSIGLITLFKEKFNYQEKLLKKLSDNSFAVYMFHPPIIVAVSLLFRPITFLPIVKWIILCIICIPLCFTVAHFIIRRIPLLNKIL